MAALAKKLGKPAPAGQRLKTYQMSDRNEFVLDRETGWPVRLTQTHKVVADDFEQTDTLTMVRVEE